jgi:gas vesicle protein
MSDALFGVLIGGIIGWIAPLLTLRYGERRWRFETKLAHLRTERARFEKLYEDALKLFGEGAVKNGYSIPMIADFLVLFPKELGDMFEKHMRNTEKTEESIRATVLELAAAMKRDLRARDEEIRKLLDAA